ncbi:MAG: hypothetical protein OEM25_08640, partial [Gammaproteobacteria bacterium]|nr:hypothetical protein [Gammaproteobacteria bacterium]
HNDERRPVLACRTVWLEQVTGNPLTIVRGDLDVPNLDSAKRTLDQGDKEARDKHSRDADQQQSFVRLLVE